MSGLCFSKVVYRNGLEREFIWRNGILTDIATGDKRPMSWEYWDKYFALDLKEQGFSFIPR